MYITALTLKYINKELEGNTHSSEDMVAEQETEYDSTVKHPTLVSPHIPLCTAEKYRRKEGVCTFSVLCSFAC